MATHAPWSLTDNSTGTPDVYEFPINPITFDLPGRQATFKDEQATSPVAAAVLFQGRDAVPRGKFGGAITSQAMFTEMKSWTSRWYPLILDDDQGNQWTILIVGYTLNRLHRAINQWRYDYEVEFIAL